VEDQDDVRRMVATALEIEGYRVDEAANAREGLDRLGQHEYQLVLSDYAMPGGTGAWMIEEASRRKLMARTAAMIITAHPDVREIADVAVIYKPLDLDYFLEQVATIVGRPRNGQKPERAVADPSSRVELVLYISSTSPASIQARRNFSELLWHYRADEVKWTVIDLLDDPLAGESDRIAFTPTLVKRYPEPRTWILGNLHNRDILTDLLRVSGIEAAR
jgi:two-component system response regulator GlrR